MTMHKKISVEVADAYELQLSDGVADLIYGRAILHHLDIKK